MHSSASRCLVLLLMIAATHAGAAQMELRSLRLRDVASLVEVSDPRALPLDDRVVYVRSSIDVDADRQVSSIWIAGPRTPERLLVGDAIGPRPSPTGDLLAFRRAGQAWLLPVRGGDPWQLTHGLEQLQEVNWSPDGKRLVLVVRDPRVAAPPAWPDDRPSPLASLHLEADEAEDFVWVPAQPQPPQAESAPEPVEVEWPVEPDQPADDSGRALPRVLRSIDLAAAGGLRRLHLWIVDVVGPGQTPSPPQRLTRGPYDDGEPTWSPDGTEVVFVSDRGALADSCACTSLWTVPVPEGEPRRLDEDRGTVSAAAWSPDGGSIAYRFVPAGAPPDAGSVRLLPLRPGGVAPVELAPGLDRPIVSAPQWAPDGSALFVTIADRGTRTLARISTGIATPQPQGQRRRRGPPEPAGRVDAVVAGPRSVESFALVNATTAVAVISQATEPAEVSLVPLQPLADAEIPQASPTAHLQGRARPVAADLLPLSRANAAWRNQVQLAEPEPLRLISEPDVAVEGWMLRPPAADAGAVLPLIVLLMDAPARDTTWAFSWPVQWLASQGYAVLTLNMRGSSGYGAAFAATGAAVAAARDVRAGIEHLAARGIIDATRVGLFGWNSDVLVRELLAEPGRFSAMVAGGDDSAAILALTEAGNAAIPTLLLAGGDLDLLQRAPATPAFMHWRRSGRGESALASLVVYPSAGWPHGPPSLIADRWLRAKAWFDRHLLGDDAADPFFGEWAR